MSLTIADFAPENKETGVGLVLQDEDKRYIFFIAGKRHHCPPGEIFYAGIGGHREHGESWMECTQREALEEVGVGVEIISSDLTWHIPSGGVGQKVEGPDLPRPYAFYEMIPRPCLSIHQLSISSKPSSSESLTDKSYFFFTALHISA